MIRYSVVIPAFNEASRLPPYLEEVAGFFDGRGELYEIVVVDDGSSDGTVATVRAMTPRYPAIRLLPLGRNRGKGAAVRAGMLAAGGALRLFTDADGATPIGELKRLEPALAAGADVVIGSRALADPSVAVRARPHRVAAGRLFSWLVARLGLRAVTDSQCGFKLFTAPAAERLFRELRTTGFRVVEVAVNWADQAGSKVGVLTSGPRMLLDVLRARWRMARG